MNTKQCSKCGTVRSLDEFARSTRRPDGRRSNCKNCQRIYREATKTRQAERVSAWKNANRDKINARRRQLRKLRREEAKAKYLADPKNQQQDEEKRRLRKELRRKKNAEYRRKNRHLDRAYYARNKEKIRAKREARCGWRVYRITFADDAYYIGSSTRPDLRFNWHKSRAGKGTHTSQALNGRKFDTASLDILKECDSEAEMLEHETEVIMAAIDRDDGCLNVRAPLKLSSSFYVYVIQGQAWVDNLCRIRVGPYYVGSSSDPSRRLRQHNGEITGGARTTRARRPWSACALYGPYGSRSEALRAEYALKRQKRGVGRTRWLVEDSPHCRGLGADHPWVADPNWKP
jgi:putative endonuclease